MQSTFMFYGKPIQVVAHNGEFYVSVRHICEGVGLAQNMQIKKIRLNAEVLRGYDIISPSAGGDQTTFCIPPPSLV